MEEENECEIGGRKRMGRRKKKERQGERGRKGEEDNREGMIKKK